MQCGLVRQRGLHVRPAGPSGALRLTCVGHARHRATQRPILSRPAQCSASSHAAAIPPPGDAARNPPPSPPPFTSKAKPLVPGWAGRTLQVVGAAAAFVVWYQLGSALQGPFASLGLAAAQPASEGLRNAVRSAWAGLAAGCLHTLAGADHLAALTPLTIGRSQFKASLLGALWGFGHSTGQLILGLLMVLLKDRFQQLVPALSKWGGATVGLTLVAIGAMGLYETFFEQHDEEAHMESDPTAEALTGLEMQGGVLVAKKERGGFGMATFATGIVYGLQPDALFVIVPALALPTKLAAAAYILMFVLGTVAAMGAYTGIIGATSAAIKKTNSGLTQKLSGFASVAALLLGLAMLLGGFGVELPFTLPFGHDHQPASQPT